MMLESAFGIYLGPLIRELVSETGIDRGELEHRLEGIDAPPSKERDRRLFELVDWIQLEAGRRELGLVFGDHLPLTAFGTFSLGLPIAPTLRDALDIIVRYHELAMPLAHCELELARGKAGFGVGFRTPMPAGAEAFLVGAIAAFFDGYLSKFTGRLRNYVRIELTEASRSMKGLYRDRFGIDATVGAYRNVLWLDAELLDATSPLADRITFDLLRTMCEQEAEALGPLRSSAELARGVVMARIGDPPSLPQLASRARLTVRQLRSKLAREGTSFQRVVRQCRVDYAVELARNPDLSLAEIGYRLGYSDPAHFSTAFKRWTGKPPSELRKWAARSSL